MSKNKKNKKVKKEEFMKKKISDGENTEAIQQRRDSANVAEETDETQQEQHSENTAETPKVAYFASSYTKGQLVLAGVAMLAVVLALLLSSICICLKILDNKFSSMESSIETVSEEVSNVTTIRPGSYAETLDALYGSVETDRYWYDENCNDFYLDPECTYKIPNSKELRFLSLSYKYGYDSEGKAVNIYRIGNEEVCYCPGNVSVNLEREY